MIKKLLCFVVGFMVFNNAYAWEYNEYKDEMREETYYYASTQSVYSNSGKQSILTVLSADNKEFISVSIGVVGEIMLCGGDSECEVAVKFDKASIRTEKIKQSSVGTLISTSAGFNVALGMSDSLFVEFSLIDKSKVQFKYELTGLKWKPVEKQGEFITSIGNVNFKTKMLLNSEDLYKNELNEDCYKSKNFQFQTINIFANEAEVCLIDNLPVRVNLSLNKKDKESLAKSINQAHGADTDVKSPAFFWFDNSKPSSLMLVDKEDGTVSLTMWYDPNFFIVNKINGKK